MKIHAIQTGTVALTRSWREGVEPDQEIGPQLERLGIAPGDVRWVVMTHLHTDHAGGLGHFADIAGPCQRQAGGKRPERDRRQVAMLRGAVDGVGADEDAERRTVGAVRHRAAA
jgi:glyoxylase-like metal-dependent hydrolase (beta-lactamase superfamily II)